MITEDGAIGSDFGTVGARGVARSSEAPGMWTAEGQVVGLGLGVLEA